MENLKQIWAAFCAWEKATTDTIDVKKCYIDMAGDLAAGVLLSQIVYWHLPGLNAKKGSRLRVQRNNRMWLAKRREDWWNEVRLTPKQVDRCLNILKKQKGIIDVAYFKFGVGEKSAPTCHIALNIDVFLSKLAEVVDSSVFHLWGSSTLPQGKEASLRVFNNDDDRRENSYRTENTWSKNNQTEKTHNSKLCGQENDRRAARVGDGYLKNVDHEEADEEGFITTFIDENYLESMAFGQNEKEPLSSYHVACMAGKASPLPHSPLPSPEVVISTDEAGHVEASHSVVPSMTDFNAEIDSALEVDELLIIPAGISSRGFRSGLRFDIETGEPLNLTLNLIDRYQEKYPHANIKQEILRMKKWLQLNQYELRKQKNWRNFVYNWFSKAEARGKEIAHIADINKRFDAAISQDEVLAAIDAC